MKKIFVLLALVLMTQKAFSEVKEESVEREDSYSFSYDAEEAKREIANEEEKKDEPKEQEKPEKAFGMKFWKY